MAELIDWLAARRHKNDPFFGYQRWYEDDEPELLSVTTGKLLWHVATAQPPFWDEPEAG